MRIIHFKKTVSCLSLSANALFAGGIFTFPLASPAIAVHSRLSQPQLTTIVLAAMMSQYPLAVVVGKIIDHRGPSVTSLIASLFFLAGFGAFSLEIYNTPLDILVPSVSSFRRMTFFFLLAGFGTVFSYFSSLFAASRTFPSHVGIASGTTMALFGLSPMFLSFIATQWFINPASGLLNVSGFMCFLAVSTGLLNTLGFFALAGDLKPQAISHPEDSSSGQSSPGNTQTLDESTSLLPAQIPQKNNSRGESIIDLITDVNFWLLSVYCVLMLGSSEMVISNIGTIVLALSPVPPTFYPQQELATARQVRLLSLSNTVTRLVVGPVADFMSPVVAISLSDVFRFSRSCLSRVMFLSGPAVLISMTFVSMNIWVTSRGNIWVLSVGTGISYSAIFTVLPSIVSNIWGVQNLGRNFGLLMFAPFIGTPVFSYIYAFVADSHSRGGVCEGQMCWRDTFWISTIAAGISFGISVLLWVRWNGRV
ncbi:major facilitator superfamily domain-containing protein [Cyathus striatus]|nr:major facilitator superfamily domain-containing protein [Cyathus striatus]